MEQEPTGYELRSPDRSRSVWRMERTAHRLGPPLRGSFDVDVAVVGGGLSGLWAAFELLERHPEHRVAIVEAEVAGAGGSLDATGCSSPWRELLAADPGAQRGVLDRFEAAARQLTERLERVAIDADLRRGPAVALASDRDELQLLGDTLRESRRGGLDESRLTWIEPEPGRRRPALTGVLGMLSLTGGLALHPGRLVDGLVTALRDRGLLLFEQSPVVAVGSQVVETDGGWLRAKAVISAMGHGSNRLLAQPAGQVEVADWYHLASEPLDEVAWARLGWPERQTIHGHDGLGRFRALRSLDGRLVWGWCPGPPTFRRLLDRVSRVAEEERLVRQVAQRLPESVPFTVSGTWVHRTVTALVGTGFGCDPVSGVYWLVSPFDDPLTAARQAASVVDLIDDEGRLD